MKPPRGLDFPLEVPTQSKLAVAKTVLISKNHKMTGPINRAIQFGKVSKGEAADEFETLGLQIRR